MIETARLLLRSWREDDHAPFAALCACPDVMALLGGPVDQAESAAMIARMCSSETKDGFCFWAIERKADGRFLGYCGLKRATVEGVAIEREVEIGWCLTGDAWGRGYAREAAFATLLWAWTRPDIDRVIAMTVPANARSWGLMERVGMVRRPELDFGHPKFAANHPLHRHIVYVATRPKTQPNEASRPAP